MLWGKYTTVLWLNKKHRSHLWKGLIQLYFNVEMILALSKVQTWCKWFSCWLCWGITIQDVPKNWGELCMSFFKNVYPWHTYKLPAWLCLSTHYLVHRIIHVAWLQYSPPSCDLVFQKVRFALFACAYSWLNPNLCWRDVTVKKSQGRWCQLKLIWDL